jgi:hypothetical protein
MVRGQGSRVDGEVNRLCWNHMASRDVVTMNLGKLTILSVVMIMNRPLLIIFFETQMSIG